MCKKKKSEDENMYFKVFSKYQQLCTQYVQHDFAGITSRVLFQ